MNSGDDKTVGVKGIAAVGATGVAFAQATPLQEAAALLQSTAAFPRDEHNGKQVKGSHAACRSPQTDPVDAEVAEADTETHAVTHSREFAILD